ncbi:MAG TPA: hypothetical protein PLP14_00825, partial [Chitinophagaceae bacterium]|nr:hypothetical protein [Chitinophagaceae bacterium]
DNRASEVILDMSKNKLVEISIRYPNITAYKRFFNELSALGFKESTLKKSTGNFRYWSSQYPNVEIIPAEIIKSGATVCDYCMVEIKIKK